MWIDVAIMRSLWNFTVEEKLSASFILNVCDLIPKGRNCLYEHRSVDIALIGDKVHLHKLSIRQLFILICHKTVIAAGDRCFPYF